MCQITCLHFPEDSNIDIFFHETIRVVCEAWSTRKVSQFGTVSVNQAFYFLMGVGTCRRSNNMATDGAGV